MFVSISNISFYFAYMYPIDKRLLGLMEAGRDAAHLYDAVMLYSWSVKTILENDLGDPKNGTLVIDLLKQRSYFRYWCCRFHKWNYLILFHFKIVYIRHFVSFLKKCCIWSAMGYYVYMDENGDAEGNYSLVSLCDINLWRINNNREYSSQDASHVTDTHGSKIKILLNDIGEICVV